MRQIPRDRPQDLKVGTLKDVDRQGGEEEVEEEETLGRHDAAQGRDDVNNHPRRGPRHLAAARPANHLRPWPPGARSHMDTGRRGCGECEIPLRCIACRIIIFRGAETNDGSGLIRDANGVPRMLKKKKI